MSQAFFYAHYQRDSWFNMAFDEWLWSKADQNSGAVHVRLYSWQPGTLTFGYNQTQEKAYHVEHLGDTPVVRRVTGGRALYHDPAEITYAVAVHHDFLKSRNQYGSIHTVAAHISEILQQFLKSCGISAQLMRRSAPINNGGEFHQTAPCFASYSRHELMVDQRKIIASAQRRSQNALLQHGSIKINGIAGHPALSLEAVDSKQDMDPTAMSVDTFVEYATLFKETFENCWDVEFVSISGDEIESDLHLNDRIKQVQKYPTKKRELIKQPLS